MLNWLPPERVGEQVVEMLPVRLNATILDMFDVLLPIDLAIVETDSDLDFITNLPYFDNDGSYFPENVIQVFTERHT